MDISPDYFAVHKLYSSVAQRFFCLGPGLLEILLLLDKRLYPGRKLPTFKLPGLQSIVELTQPAVHLSDLGLEKLKSLLLLVTALSQLLVGQPHQLLQVLLGEDVPLDSVNDKALNLVLGQERSSAYLPTLPAGIAAHVVEELTRLHGVAYERCPAFFTADHPAQDILAVDYPGVSYPGRPGSQLCLSLVKDFSADDARPGPFDMNWGKAIGATYLPLLSPIPDQYPGIGLIMEHVVHRGAAPLFACPGGQAIMVKPFGNLLEPLPR